ncbi:MAG: hypothetical protein HEQ20_05295 [Aphanizomenon flos-aquae KM1D3_PB]|uniref:hypothetical protein n=1 Tax=Aphanizomenon flos-aquae TaxID=1176 RepID=UPI00190F44D5|nr:hypothetical protein [Aphanizomenon flos-aquae]QSV69350.1 MAG: hypothetical protein HEQ20_05295 [Aphanizomenon flos-aquae KM1D3_PB]
MSFWEGKSEEALGDFTFLYTLWFYCVHLLSNHNYYLLCLLVIFHLPQFRMFCKPIKNSV